MNGVTKCVVSFILAFSLLGGTGFSQSQNPPPQSQEEIAKDKYQKLFSITNAWVVQAGKVCKTDACATLVPDTLKMLSDAKDKFDKKQFFENDRIEFHKKHLTNVTAIRNEMVQQMLAKHPEVAAAASLKPPDVPALCRVGYYPSPDSCQICYDIFENLAEICALYAFVSPEASLICLAAATLGFGRCVLDNCQGPGYWPIN
jgi:hypothetical protein